MICRWLSFTLSTMSVLSAAAFAQGPSPQPAAPPNYSQEAAVIEQMSTKVTFDNDGKRSREQATRVRVKTDAGVQEWGLLSLPYQSATETVEVGYVRVLKPDNTTVNTPPDNIQDLDAQITRDAPFYSDLREKHIAVKGLAKGDVLEYMVQWHPMKPLIPGQFWFEYNFRPEGVVLDESVEIRVPAGRAVKFKGPQATQTIKGDGASRMYSWSFSRAQSAKATDSDKKNVEAVRGRLPVPDIQLSSFQSWDEVGQWYWNLQKDRIEPSPAVRAKAQELTKGLSDDAAKLQALYSFVSTQYRYIGIAFGIGRYQPHAADDVLGNNYGDCKDKHTLLAALLQASGFTIYPALINSGHVIDPDVPSPGQFDHIIGYFPQGKTVLWLDTTPEVGPLGYLYTPLRDKPALVMMGEKSAKLINTPADPPFPTLQTFTIDAKLKEDGSLEAKVQDSSRGDAEVALRAAFRRMPQPQWNDLVQQISYALGYAGTVSDASASAPDILTEPFHFSYSYNRKDYPDWTNRQFTVPGHPFAMPPVKDDADAPLWLGGARETVSDSNVELPKGYKPQLPSNVDVKYDFAEYHAAYSMDQGVLTARRRMLIKVHEVPVTELADYRSFIKNIQNDVNRYVQTSSSSAATGGSGSTPTGMLTSFLAGIRNLPDSTLTEANLRESDAHNPAFQSDPWALANAFKRVVDADPKFTRAWVELSVVYMTLQQDEPALDALHKAIESDPKQLLVQKIYALELTTLRRNEAAMRAWQDFLKIAPDDPDANSVAAKLLEQGKDYAGALPYLEALAKHDTSPSAQIRLGSAYLKAGQREKGSATLQKIIDADSKPVTMNDVAYEMVEADTDLPKALDLSQRAVDEQEKLSHDVDLSNLLNEDLDCTQKIGSFWDTLGWIQFRLGHFNEAESYLNAAWLLTQIAAVADHLGQVYEKEKKTDKAIHMYHLALGTPYGHSGNLGPTSDRLDRLERLHPADVKSPVTLKFNRLLDGSGDELSKIRTVKLKRLLPGTATAEFFLLFGPGPKLEDVSFISGSEKLKPAADGLYDAEYKVAFPMGSAAHLVRRALVMCSPVSGCMAVLYTPDSVHSVN